MKDELIKRILISVKQISGVEPVVSFSGEIARVLAIPITLVTVIENNSGRQKAEERLAQAQKLLPDLEVATRVCRSQVVAKELLAELERGDYGLLAIGEVAESVLAHLLFGSLAKYLVGRAPCPVLVVRGECGTLKRLLICTGGRKISEPVVRMGSHLAQAAKADVTLLHITTPVPSMYTGLSEMEETLTELLQTNTLLARHLRWCARVLDNCGIPTELKLRHGVVIDEIIRETQSVDYDLVVLGSHVAENLWRELIMDNVTRQAIDRVNCPVLVV